MISNLSKKLIRTEYLQGCVSINRIWHCIVSKSACDEIGRPIIIASEITLLKINLHQVNKSFFKIASPTLSPRVLHESTSPTLSPRVLH